MVHNTSYTPDRCAVDEYPKLMLGSEAQIVVLFTKDGTGTVVLTPDKNPTYPLGYFSNAWDMSCFEFYKRGVKLQNV